MSTFSSSFSSASLYVTLMATSHQTSVHGSECAPVAERSAPSPAALLNHPLPCSSSHRFNFRFSVADDMCAPDSLELLNKAGLDFERHDKLGIDVEYFGEVLITSGLALFPEVKWVSFHSGYDFGYLVKVSQSRGVVAASQSGSHALLTTTPIVRNFSSSSTQVVSCAPLPPTESDFFSLLRVWFPTIYDIKYLMRSCKTLKGGLQDVAEELGVARIGQQHQAGSDSLLTAATFFKLRSRFFDGVIDDSKFVGALYGFSASSRPNAVAGVGSGASAAALADSTINGGSGAVVTR